MKIPEIITELLDRQVAYLDALAGFAGVIITICGFIIVRHSNLIQDDKYVDVRAFWMVPIVAVLSSIVVVVAFIGNNIAMTFVQDALRLADPCLPNDFVNCTETPLSIYRDNYKVLLRVMRSSALYISGAAALTSLIWLWLQIRRKPNNDTKTKLDSNNNAVVVKQPSDSTD